MLKDINSPTRSSVCQQKLMILSVFICVFFTGMGRLVAETFEVFETTYEAKLKGLRGGEAEKEVYAEAVREVTLQKIKEIIGAEKAVQSKSVIDRKILKESGKFVSYMKGGKIRLEGQTQIMPVTLRLSLANLRTMLSEEGLLYQEENITKILPLVGLVDRVHGQSYQWWIEESSGKKTFLRQQSQLLQEHLQNAFWKNNFYVHRPVADLAAPLMPVAFRQESYRTANFVALGEIFQAQVVLQGEVKLLNSPHLAEAVRVSSRMSAVHASTGRVIGEVTREFETESGNFEEVVRTKLAEALPGMAEDLAIQVLQTWQRGVLGANVINVAFRGRLGPAQLENLKAELVRKITAIKSVRERLFEPGQVTLEVDSSENLKQLVYSLKRASLAGFNLKVGDASEEQNTLFVDIH